MTAEQALEIAAADYRGLDYVTTEILDFQTMQPGVTVLTWRVTRDGDDSRMRMSGRLSINERITIWQSDGADNEITNLILRSYMVEKGGTR